MPWKKVDTLDELLVVGDKIVARTGFSFTSIAPVDQRIIEGRVCTVAGFTKPFDFARKTMWLLLAESTARNGSWNPAFFALQDGTLIREVVRHI